MKLYLAGGVSANLKSIWSKITNMKLFLAGGESRHWIYENIGEIMQIFLAGENDLMGGTCTSILQDKHLGKRGGCTIML